MMRKFKTFNKCFHGRINITSIWTWFSIKDLNILKLKKKTFFQNQNVCSIRVYIFNFILFYIRTAISIQTNAKRPLKEKKNTPIFLITEIIDPITGI